MTIVEIFAYQNAPNSLTQNLMSGPNRVAEMAKNIAKLHPYPPNQNLINSQHFYHNSMLLDWTNQTPHPVSLRQLANFGKRLTVEKLISSANFVRTELPLRLSLKIRELQSLPFDVISNYHLNQVYQSYYYCFSAFRRVSEIKSLDDNVKFCRFVSKMLDDHLIVLPHLMMGALEVSVLKSMTQDQLDAFMSSMIRSRVSRRVIMNQHICMSGSYMENLKKGLDPGDKPPDFVGEAFQYLSAHEQLKLSYDSVAWFLKTQDPDLKVPELIIKGDDVRFQFMTNHLNYILTEIIRNGLKSTIEQTKTINEKTKMTSSLLPPPFVVEITVSKKDIYLKFSDQGGGVPLFKLPKVWSFGKTPELAMGYLENFHDLPGLDLPIRLPIVDHAYFNADECTPPPLQGMLSNLGNLEITSSDHEPGSMLRALCNRPFNHTLGISLPMCYVYADYWNGELSMNSVEGYGTDVVWRVSKLGTSEAEGGLDRA